MHKSMSSDAERVWLQRHSFRASMQASQGSHALPAVCYICRTCFHPLQVHEISRLARMRMVWRLLHEWGRANRLLGVAGSIQVMGARALCLAPAYALLGDHSHMWFHLAWLAWKNLTLGRWGTGAWWRR